MAGPKTLWLLLTPSQGFVKDNTHFDVKETFVCDYYEVYSSSDLEVIKVLFFYSWFLAAVAEFVAWW
jgi:hypothetical protein